MRYPRTCRNDHVVSGPEDETPAGDGSYGKCIFCARIQWDKYNHSEQGRDRFNTFNASTKGIVRSLAHDLRKAHLEAEDLD